MPRTCDPRHVGRRHRRWVYHFNATRCDGDDSMAELLGGKGAQLAQMTRLGLPVPPGFTITTAACAAYHQGRRRLPADLRRQMRASVAHLESVTQRKLGSETQPLLLSVRSGAAVSMPGMMDTVLNLGINDSVCAAMAGRLDRRRLALDAYRRLINMFGNVVAGIEHDAFERRLAGVKKKYRAASDAQLDEQALAEVVDAYKRVYADHAGEPFPQNVHEQLDRAVAAVFDSWLTPRAVAYRQFHRITDRAGTAANVQMMVFGNLDQDSASGVGFTRDPATGENTLIGEYVRQAQGEDVVAGIRTPQPLAELQQWKPGAYRRLIKIKRVLEAHYRDMQDIEFTIEHDELFMLQTRTGKRTAAAAARIATDMVRQRLIDRREAVKRIAPEQVTQLLLPSFAQSTQADVLTRGLPASPGAAVGRPVFTAAEARDLSRAGEAVILVRPHTSADDVEGMHEARGVLTATGGITSHAAVVARGWGKPCVVGASQLHVQPGRRMFEVRGRRVTARDTISLDGATGEVMFGAMPLNPPTLSREADTLLRWADGFRRLGVRANADTPDDARRARAFGAAGVGLCRTEHMFFGEDRVRLVRQMILTDDPASRAAALDALLPWQRDDFVGILSAMRGLPVTIRLLDPPLHEFLPTAASEQRDLARHLRISSAALRRLIAAHHEVNPMLGNRGCRLLLTLPGILDMQVRAIVQATIACRRERIDVRPQIMVPLVSHENELRLLRTRIEQSIDRAREAAKFTGRLPMPIGTMIETPRAALVADRIARFADFFSFGTNDLTQMALGISRDDVGLFMPTYLDQHLLDVDPFASVDVPGVGQLIRSAIERGRSVRPELEIGICGEHGGDPASIAFCHEAGVDYVSCSPFRVPAARLAAGRTGIDHDQQATIARKRR